MKSLFKCASLLFAAAMLFACEGANPDNGELGGDESGSLEVTPSRTYVQTFGGDFVDLTVTYNGEKVTEGVIFYDVSSKTPVLMDIPGPDFKFSTTKDGKYSIRALYGSEQSESITIFAFSEEIPETPADPTPSKTTFKARMLVTEVTATGCRYCPGMKKNLKSVMADEEIADMVVMTSCHNNADLSAGDACYISTSYAKQSPPYLYCDMYAGVLNVGGLTAKMIKEQFRTIFGHKEEDAAGLSVNAVLKDRKVVMKVTIKAAIDGDYRIGAFLLEDNVESEQRGDGAEEWMNIHNHVIRHLDSKYTTAVRDYYTGHSVGKVKAGETADYVFVWDLDEIWRVGDQLCEKVAGSWAKFDLDQLHAAVFVSSMGTDQKGNKVRYINNVIDCPINGQTPYEYR